MNTATSIARTPLEKGLLKRALLVCGMLSSFLYIAMLIFVAMGWNDYSSSSQTVSELSAIDAPTRGIWVLLGTVYSLLAASFGLGIRKCANGNRSLMIIGTLMIFYGLLGLFWPPMHQREVLASGGSTLTDTLHIVWTLATVLLMLFAIEFGSAAFTRPFRLYSKITILLLLTFGLLTGLESRSIQENLPTPLAGVWERINIGVFLVWLIIFSFMLLRRERIKN